MAGKRLSFLNLENPKNKSVKVRSYTRRTKNYFIIFLTVILVLLNVNRLSRFKNENGKFILSEPPNSERDHVFALFK